MSKTNRIPLIETAIVAAMAMALSYIPDFASWFTPSFGAVPLVIFALRRGTKYGLIAGFIWGALHFLLGKVYYFAFSQVLIEYLLAFISMGIAGLASASLKKHLRANLTNKALFASIWGASLAIFVRYFWHYLAGVIFWGSYAPKGMSAVLYSFSVNGLAGALTLLITIIALLIIIPTQPNFFLPNQQS